MLIISGISSYTFCSSLSLQVPQLNSTYFCCRPARPYLTLFLHSNSLYSSRSSMCPSSLMLLASYTSKESFKSRSSALLPTLLLIFLALMMNTSAFSKSSM